ncbi:MAG: hypothetical protein M4D80_05740 [Myxococcota bacterium]|nr:hypothetical protein [Myxococcota bacterium]
MRGGAIDVGGNLTARSVAGKGTTWTVSIPITPLSAEGARSSLPPSCSASSEGLLVRPDRIPGVAS